MFIHGLSGWFILFGAIWLVRENYNKRLCLNCSCSCYFDPFWPYILWYVYEFGTETLLGLDRIDNICNCRYKFQGFAILFLNIPLTCHTVPVINIEENINKIN